jgi:general secretion pathway protein D
MIRRFGLLVILALSLWAPLRRVQAQQDSTVIRNDSVTVRFVDADLRGVFQLLGHYLRKPLLATGVPGERVTLDYPAPLPASRIPELLRGLADAHNLELTEEEVYYRLGPKRAPGAAADATQVRQGDTIELFVIRLKHAHAADVAATVNVLFGGGGEFSGRPGLSGVTLSDELRSEALPPAGTPPGPPAPSAGRGPTPATLRGPTTVVPDELTNSLLIRASRADYDVLAAAVTQLDIRPLQVLIEVLIVEARRDRSFNLGTALSTQYTDGNHVTKADLTGAGAGDLVLQFLQAGRHQVSAVLSLAQSRGDVQIVSRPVLVTSNNTEAHFMVGSQRPFVQISRSLPTESATRDQIVQYKDVGTKLTVRPTINDDGYVSLLVQQEISAATTETQFDAPVISTREARTQILVRDGQTVVIGGLTDEQRTRTSSGIPILSGIPIIGGLFGRTSRDRSTTELFLFLTPRILRTDADADSVTIHRLPDRKPADDRRP